MHYRGALLSFPHLVANAVNFRVGTINLEIHTAMPNGPKGNADYINIVIKAWETLRPTKSFGGYTLANFKANVKPSFDARTNLDTLSHQTIAAIDQRDDADAASLDAIKLVVAGVKADPAETAKGELYEAMGYVRESERASGLTRKKKTAPATKS